MFCSGKGPLIIIKSGRRWPGSRSAGRRGRLVRRGARAVTRWLRSGVSESGYSDGPAVVDSGPGRAVTWLGQGGALACQGWVGLGVTLHFNRRQVVSFMCFPFALCVRLFGFFLIDLLSDLLTHGQTLKVLEAALWLRRHN